MALGISSWLEPTNKFKLANNILELPDDVKQTHICQTNIGWEHFVRGRISISWGTLLNKMLAGKKDDFNTEACSSKLASINFKYILLLWDHRNKNEHGDNVEDIESNLIRKLMAEITYIQQKFHSNHYKDNNFINCDAQEFKELDSGQLQGWLAGARILFKKFKNTIPKQSILSTDKNSKRALENDHG